MHPLDDPAALGPFFAVRTGGVPPGRPPRDEGYVPFADVHDGSTAALDRRIDVVAGRLGTRERRVAASTVHLGLCARLWSAALGSAALTGRVPDLAAGRLWWNPERTAPDDLWLPAGPDGTETDDGRTGGTETDGERTDGGRTDVGGPGGPGACAHGLRAAVVTGHLAPLHDAVRAACRLPAALLWGNAGSALAGSLRVLDGWCREHHRPEAAERAAAWTRELLAAPPLDTAGTLAPPAADGPPHFRRRTCCLYYRVPGGGLCGDCVLPARPRT